MQGGLSELAGGGVRQMRFPHKDCRGIRNREIVEKERRASERCATVVDTASSGTC